MYAKFPFSMENLPRQKGFACLSLKFGCIFSALVLILYSVLAVAQCIALLGVLYHHDNENFTSYAIVVAIGMIHFVTMLLTTVMLIGTIREKHQLMKPWVVWTSCQLLAGLLMFVFFTTMNMINHAEVSLLVYIVDFMSLYFGIALIMAGATLIRCIDKVIAQGKMIRFYMLVLVSSYMKDLQEEAGNERIKRLMEENDIKYSAV